MSIELASRFYDLKQKLPNLAIESLVFLGELLR